MLPFTNFSRWRHFHAMAIAIRSQAGRRKIEIERYWAIGPMFWDTHGKENLGFYFDYARKHPFFFWPKLVNAYKFLSTQSLSLSLSLSACVCMFFYTMFIQFFPWPFVSEQYERKKVERSAVRFIHVANVTNHFSVCSRDVFVLATWISWIRKTLRLCMWENSQLIIVCEMICPRIYLRLWFLILKCWFYFTRFVFFNVSLSSISSGFLCDFFSVVCCFFFRYMFIKIWAGSWSRARCYFVFSHTDIAVIASYCRWRRYCWPFSMYFILFAFICFLLMPFVRSFIQFVHSFIWIGQ